MNASLRALHALGLMRRGRSLTAAAKASGTTTKTVLRYARQALKCRAGHYVAVSYDQLQRPMRVLTERGVAVVDVRSSNTASRIAQYWNAVDHYLRTGDQRPLARFVGKRFRAQGQLFPFITDPRALNRLAQVGHVSFEDLYENAA